MLIQDNMIGDFGWCFGINRALVRSPDGGSVI